MKQVSSLFSALRRIEGLPVATVLLALYGAFIITAPGVFTGHLIYMSFLQTVSPMLVCALGLTFVITAGEIDLSFPAVVAFAGFVFAWFFENVQTPWAPYAGLVLALAAGGLVGYINGLLVAKIGVPSIMATLATRFFWYGVTVLLAGGRSWSISDIRGSFLHQILVGRLFGVIPVQALWALALTIFLWFILNRHRFGEAIMFIGDNAEVARVMGVDVEATKIRLFTMNGVLAAFGAILLTLDIGVFFPTQGESYLLSALSAVFIGGTSIAGGFGSVVGTLFGAYIIGSLEAGVVASRISGYWVQLVQGLVMGASVTLNLVLEQGRITTFANRLRQWGLLTRSNAISTVSRQEDTALK
jgi:simple sugar transport system permease protein